MRQTLLIVWSFVLASPGLEAQEGSSLDPFLKNSLDRSGGDEGINLFVRGNISRIERYFRSHEGLFKFSSDGYAMVRLRADEVRSFRQRAFVDRILVQAGKGRTLNDTMRVRNRIQGILEGKGLPRSYTGTDVILGYIDSGVDLDHPDFQDSTGRTKVLTLWDQTLPDSANTPPSYGYGQEWDSTSINAGNCPHVDQNGYSGHGSSVASVGSGTGNATGKHKGGAPGSDMIIVSNDLDAPNWTSTIVDGVDYILDRADSIGKPVVINTSVGTYLGPHDAEDPAALMIDSLLRERNGQMLVAAAGNAGHIPFHLSYDVNADTNFTWFEYNPSSTLGYGAVYFEAWADTSEFRNVEYAIGADRRNPSYLYRGRTPFHSVQVNLDSTIRNPLLNAAGDTIAKVETYAQRIGGRYKLQVHLKEPDSSDYYFRFMTTGSGSFDVWSDEFLGTSPMVDEKSLPDSSVYPDIVNYQAPDRRKTIVGSWTCSEEVFTVGNYVGRVRYPGLDSSIQTVSGTPGAIAANSSRGPTRRGRLKPDVAATGKVLMTASKLSFIDQLISSDPHKVDPDSMHVRNGGTSVAAPVAASIAALYLDRCPWTDHRALMKVLSTTARKDSFTGKLPNDRWGHGKVDASDALAESLYDAELAYWDSIRCGDPIAVSTQEAYLSYHWSDGSNGSPLLVDSSGTYYAEVRDSSGCPAYTDSVELTVHPLPPEPTVYQQGDSLFTDMQANSYRWFRNGTPISGATEPGYGIEKEGAFHLIVADSNGCRRSSDTLHVLPSRIPEREASEPSLTPNPAHSRVIIRSPRSEGELRYELIGPEGKVRKRGKMLRGEKEKSLELGTLSAGLYLFRWRTDRDQGGIKLIKR